MVKILGGRIRDDSARPLFTRSGDQLEVPDLPHTRRPIACPMFSCQYSEERFESKRELKKHKDKFHRY